MPELDLNEEASVGKAKAQILHQEPLILSLPDQVELNLPWEKFNCEFDAESANHYDCDGGPLLSQLAEKTHIGSLKTLADACEESSSRVDVDIKNNRIIFHD
jgi:hypothetical protein